MKGRASCNRQTASARRCLIATLPRAGSTDATAPGPAQPDASFMLRGPVIYTWSPTLKRPYLDSVARVSGGRG
eukprot:7394214-Pyramimonas_sp.AAC.1